MAGGCPYIQGSTLFHMAYGDVPDGDFGAERNSKEAMFSMKGPTVSRFIFKLQRFQGRLTANQNSFETRSGWYGASESRRSQILYN